MNAKQHKFCIEYLKGISATEAAMLAGYSKKTAYSQGQRLLSKNDEVIAFIQQEKRKIAEDAEISITEIVKEIRVISKTDKSKNIRLKAYDMLMKHLGGYQPEFERLSDEDLDRLLIKLEKKNGLRN